MPIASSELKFFKSSSGVGLGGAISGTEIVSGNLNNLFDDVSSAQSFTGITEYRCLYVKNTNAAINLLNTLFYIEADSSSTDTSLEIGLGTAGPNATEQTIPDEETAPAAVVFEAGIGAENALAVGTVDFNGGYHAIWIKRVVAAESDAQATDLGSLTIDGETTA